MSKGREVVITKAISKEDSQHAKPYGLTDFSAGQATSQGLPAPGEKHPGNKTIVTAEQIEALQQQAHREAYHQGHAEGLKQGLADARQQIQQQIQQQVNTFSGLVDQLNQPFEALDEQVISELSHLVTSITKHLIRRELKVDPGQIIAVVREGVAALPVATRNVHLYLHPEDARLVRETMSISDEHGSWAIHEDPTLTRGGCRITTENSQIDATVESRLAAVIVQAFGEERESDSERT